MLNRLRKTISSFKRDDSILKMPKDVNIALVLSFIFTAITSLVSQALVFVFNLSTNAINNGAILVGVILFLIYSLQNPIISFIRFFSAISQDNYNEKEQLVISERTANIIKFTRDKIKSEDENGILKTMSTSDILINFTTYIESHRNLLKMSIESGIHFFIFLLSLGGLFVVAVNLSKTLNFNIFNFAIAIIISIVTTVTLTILHLRWRNKYHFKIKSLRSTTENMKMDLLTISPMNEHHMNFLVNNFIQAKTIQAKLAIKNSRKRGLTLFFRSLSLSLILSIMLASTIFSIGLNSITPAIFLSITAFSEAFSQIISSISNHIQNAEALIDLQLKKEKYKPYFRKIMEVYNESKSLNSHKLDCVSYTVPEFNYSYSDGDNKEVFTLASKKAIVLKSGELVLLKGPSGAGKSTFAKLLIGEIGDNKNLKLKSISYFKELQLGHGSLLQEITLQTDIQKVDEERLEKILKGVELYHSFVLKADSKNIFEYLNAVYKDSLSTGQDQRILLARVLYHLDDVDIVCIDEPIGYVDKETAIKVISFIKKYCNQDRNRVLVIATHQYEFVSDLIDKTINFKPISPKVSIIS